MRQFKCTICGYIYDEAKGIPEKGIEAGTKWEDLPDDWQCPWCGAPKAMFVEVGVAKVDDVTINSKIEVDADIHQELREVSFGELSAICSNLAKGCSKQYLEDQSKLFGDLASYFKTKDKLDSKNSYDELLDKINSDLENEYPIIRKMCVESKDRATLRAITWGEKSTLILKSLLMRFKEEGDSFLDNTKVYVCDICGFIYIGNDVPEVCPICKVPSLKILEIKEVE
ncbi:MAG: rubredoxin [Bacilli bacterium]